MGRGFKSLMGRRPFVKKLGLWLGGGLRGPGLRAIEKNGRFGAFWPNGGLATIPLENRPTCAHRAISFNMESSGG